MGSGTDGIREVAVFCGARSGTDPAFAEGARRLGAGLADRGIGLVYGGGRVGLMGVLADAVLDGGGRVAGIIPGFLSDREVAHPRVTDLTVTDSMHARKRLMFARADAFLTLPGGLGTFDETIEVITWRQLGLHRKPIGIVDRGGWSRCLQALLDEAVRQGFADGGTRDLFDVMPDEAAALDWLGTVRSPRPPDAAAGRL